MNKVDIVTAQKVAKQVESLMLQADLTVYGLAEGTSLSTHTINRILKQRTNISSGSAKKIAEFFAISVDRIFSDSPIKLKKIEHLPNVSKFHSENSDNHIFFISKAKEGKVATFIREKLLQDPFLAEGKRSRDVAAHIKLTYKKSFDTKVVAKALERLYRDGALTREDKTGKNSVFYYSIKNTNI